MPINLSITINGVNIETILSALIGTMPPSKENVVAPVHYKERDKVVIDKITATNIDHPSILITDGDIRRVQKIVDGLLQTHPGESKSLLIARAIKQLKIATTVSTMIQKIKFPEGYMPVKKPFSISDEIIHDAACLFAGGVSTTVCSVICEVSATVFQSERMWREINKVSAKDIYEVKEKYKEYLELYRIYEKFRIRENLKEIARDHLVRQYNPVKHRMNTLNVVTPDEVRALVSEYEKIISKKKPITTKGALLKAARNCGIKASLFTLQRAVFAHQNLEGYEDIKTPIVIPTKPKPISDYESLAVQEIKYLRDVKHLPLMKVRPMLGLKPRFIDYVYNGYTKLYVEITPENMAVFEEKYKDI